MLKLKILCFDSRDRFEFLIRKMSSAVLSLSDIHISETDKTGIVSNTFYRATPDEPMNYKVLKIHSQTKAGEGLTGEVHRINQFDPTAYKVVFDIEGREVS